jgi:hypothetical protein
LREATGWAPDGHDWHLWYVEIDQVAWFQVVFGAEAGDGDEEVAASHETEVWRPAIPSPADQ